MNFKTQLWAVALLLMLASSCQKESNQAVNQTSNQPQTQIPSPPPPLAGNGDPVAASNFGSLDPNFPGVYGWSDYYDATLGTQVPFTLVYDAASGTWKVVFSFYYMGIVGLDAMGNRLDPFAGAVMEVKLIPCNLTGSDEEIFNLPTTPIGVEITKTQSSNIWYEQTPGTWNYSSGDLMNAIVTKQAFTACYIIKITINGNVYYRRVTVP